MFFAYLIVFAVGVFIGITWQKVKLEINLSANYGVPLEAMSSEESTDKAQKIADFLKKRLEVSLKVMASEETYQRWIAAYGSDTIEELTGPQDANERFGSWWLANFITLVDICGCKLILQDKDKDE